MQVWVWAAAASLCSLLRGRLHQLLRWNAEAHGWKTGRLEDAVEEQLEEVSPGSTCQSLAGIGREDGRDWMMMGGIGRDDDRDWMMMAGIGCEDGRDWMTMARIG